MNLRAIPSPTETIEVRIPEGASLNGPEQPQGFPEEVFSRLPEPLREACLEVLTEPQEREAFLVGALGVLSGILPKVQGFYDGSFTGPNLYCYVLAAYGTGKGFLKYAKELAAPVHRQKRKEHARDMEEWQAMGEGGGQQPARPPNKMLFLPANNSKSGFLQLLHENKCRGILFETEGDTLAETLATDYGNFSDVLRKAFHHEESTFFRRGEQEYRDLEQPALSVVLSSTFDQLLRLIPTIQNGLFSRFLFYELPGNREFRNVFDQRKQVYPEYFAQLGEHFLDLYNNLESREEPITFSLHPNQQAEFVSRFGEWKDELGEFVGADLDGVVHRLGLISFRIAMIFSTLRAFGSGTLNDSLSCEQVDFENALTLVSALRKNAINIYFRLPRPKQPKEASEYERELVGKADKIATCRLLQAQGRTYAEIAKNVLGDERKKATVWKWLNAKN